MTSDDTTTEAPTRRDVVKLGSAAAGAGLLAGCTDSLPGDGGSSDGGGDPTATDTSYTVSMEPVGEVEFDAVPETWVSFTGDWADMGVALGQAEGLEAVGIKARYASHYYDELPGVSVDTGSIGELYNEGIDKERFYDIGADLHVIDPNFMVNRLGLSEADVTELRENVAPFFGNTSFSTVYDWHDGYRHYDLYEAFGKLADVFQERERYEAFASYHDEVVADVESRLPEERPDVAVLFPAGAPPEAFYPYLIGEGTQSKQWRDLGVGDALGTAGVTDAQAGGGTVDYETLLDIDPDVLAVRLQGEVTDEAFEERIVSHLEAHDVASELSAVRNDRVVYGGHTYQGPIIHLFQLERAAQGVYPDEFGGEQLFDRQRVADIVDGAV
jgi:iron complex transport system substrate-binding protein